jgi:hypothetical protein
MEMLKYEIEVCKSSKTIADKDRNLPSVAPWEALVRGLPPELVKQITCCYASRFPRPAQLVGDKRSRRSVEGGPFNVLLMSSDLLDHSTMHLIAAGLIEMHKLRNGRESDSFQVMCTAKPGRIPQPGVSRSPYREAVKTALGPHFIEAGAWEDAQISKFLVKGGFDIILFFGCHQDGDRPQVLACNHGAKVLQLVAHMGTSGSPLIGYFVCDEKVIEGCEEHFVEEILKVDLPMLPNSFRMFYSQNAEGLDGLWKDDAQRAALRQRLGLPTQGLLVVNISHPRRQDEQYIDKVCAILTRTPGANYVIIDHNRSATARLRDHFVKEGLQDRLYAVEYQDLPSGALHRFLAVCDLYLDTFVFNGMTALVDALWAIGIAVTVRGSTVPSRVGANLLSRAGLTEFICQSEEEAVDLVCKLLPDRERLRQLRETSSKGRLESKFYDAAAYAKSLDNELKKLMVGNCRPLLPVPTESESSQGTDVTDAQFQNVLEKLSPYFSIDWNSLVNVKKEDGFISVCGTYRGVKTDLMVVDRLDPDPDTNGAFREMQARGGNPRNDDEMIFRTQFQYNEKQPWLDLITVKVQGRTAHVIIQEVFPDQRPAAELFDALAAECGASPFRPPMDKLTALVHGLLVLIRKLHQGGMAYGADPRRCLLSSLKNGHGKKAAAHVLDENGDPVALLLGNATHVQQNGFKFHDKSRTERSQQAQAVRSVHVTKRAKDVLKGALAASSGRSSQRLAAKEQNITWPDIILEHRVEVNSNIKELQAADIGRICNLMVNILKGSHGDNCNAWPAIPRSKDLIHIQLLKHCLEGNPGVTAESLREHCGCGPVADSQSLESSYTK